MKNWINRATLTGLALLMLIAGVPVTAHAQTTITSTTASAAVAAPTQTAPARTVVVASATGITAGSEVYVDAEAMLVTAVNSTTLTVQRGYDATVAGAHASGATVYAGPTSGVTGSPFAFSDPPLLTCVLTSELYSLRINVVNGNIWQCAGGQWNYTPRGVTKAVSAIDADVKVLAATAAFTSNATLANLTGFSWPLVAGRTYQFEINLPTTMTTNGGISVALTQSSGLTLTSIQVDTYESTATDNSDAVSTQSTTTTSATKYVDTKTAAYTIVKLHGTMVVNAGGTLTVQAAQNTSHADTTSVLLGSYAKVTRVN